MMEPRKNLRKSLHLLFLTLIFAFTVTISTVAATNVDVTKYAGTGNAGKTDASLSDSAFYGPYGLAVDKDGGIIVADSTNNLIRKIVNGKVTTIAGISDKLNNFEEPKGGFADGDATEARFNKPRYVAVSASGKIYISDGGNNLIRKLIGGQVTTVAGIGKAGYTDGERDVASFNCPSGIAIDASENLYVADSLNHVIRKITPTGKVTTYAGKNSLSGGYKDGSLSNAEFNEPSDLAFSKDGALYVLDSGNQMVRKILNGKVTTICGKKSSFIPGTTYMNTGLQDGYGVDAKLNFPKGLFVDGTGTVFIADTWNNAVRAITKSGKIMTIAGTGAAGNQDGFAGNSSFNGPSDIVLIGSKLYVSDLWNNSIREITVDTKNLVGVGLSNNPAFGIKFKPKSSIPQISVVGTMANLGKKDFIKKGDSLLLSIKAIGKALGGQVNWNKGTGNLTIIKADKTYTFNVKKDPVTIVSGVPMMDARIFAEALDLNSYSVPENNAMIFYVK